VKTPARLLMFDLLVDARGRDVTGLPLDERRRRLEALAAEHAQLSKESAGGLDHAERIAAIDAETTQLKADLEALEKRWQEELALVGEIHAKLDIVEALAADAPERAAAVDELNAARARLKEVQGQEPMVNALVDGGTAAQIIAAWTGIPLGKMVSDEIQTILALRENLEQRVIGQGHALEAIAQRVRTSRANLEDPNKPKGVFLLVGTSGVGKTETAVALADILYGGERNMITINMSEYQEAHTVSSLKGSPPGYVGYGEGGVLTEAVRRKPYSVVLLDEVEKAHPDVMELFFQVFDKGRMEDGEGREIDFRNTLIILTSNAGTDLIMRVCADPEAGVPPPEQMAELLRPELQKHFKPAFLGRTTVIPYYPLRDEDMKQIVRLKLGKIARRIDANHGARFDFDEALVDAVAARCTEVDSGARNIDNILNGTLLPEVAGHVLARMGEGLAITGIQASVDGEGRFAYALT
jgi:type VI secretion system protein VasG